MSRVYMFNPLVAPKFDPKLQQIITVNADSQHPYKINRTYPQLNYQPLSASGQRSPGLPPQGNAFCDTNQLGVDNPGFGTSRYPKFDLGSDVQRDMIAYVFADRIILLKQDGNYVTTFCPSNGGEAKGFAGRRPHASAAKAADDNGSVWVFNVNPVTIAFSVNNGDISENPMKGWATDTKLYTPAVVKVERVLNKNDSRGKFWGPLDGRPRDNPIVITPDGPDTGSFKLKISSALNNNLFLYVLQDRWLLFDDGAELLDHGPITFSAGQPAA